MIPEVTCHPLAAAAELLYFALLLAGAGWDIACRRLPNWLTLAVALAFIPWSLASGMDVDDYVLSALAAAICFGIGFALFQMRLMGAGDVKLIVGIALWTGLRADLVRFLMYMGIAGGFLALLFLCVRLVAKRNLGELPYGVAIVIGALIVRLHASACFVWL
jgi:prepilin peptidase CpaA